MDIYKPPEADLEASKPAFYPMHIQLLALPIIYFISRFCLYVVVPNFVKLILGRDVDSFTTYELDIPFLILDEVFSIFAYASIYILVLFIPRLKGIYLISALCMLNSFYTYYDTILPGSFGSAEFPLWYDLGLVFNCWLGFAIALLIKKVFSKNKANDTLEQNNTNKEAL